MICASIQTHAFHPDNSSPFYNADSSIGVAGQAESKAWTFTANGAGFQPAEARMQAEERIIKQINDKSDMTLGLPAPNN